jgi:gliding motility-associated-like protein
MLLIRFINYTDTGRYTITLYAVNNYGCDDEKIRDQYIVIDPAVTVYIPNAFAPNGMGPVQNRTFKAEPYGIADFRMQVYNRWGNLLFESYDHEDGWDGTFQGEPVEEGVYAYMVRVIGLDGREYNFSGTVTLIR